MDWTPPDSSVHGVFQARILEWVAISFSLLFYNKGNHLIWEVLLIISNMPNNLSIFFKYILTTFLSSLLKVLRPHIISSFLSAPENSIPYNLNIPTWFCHMKFKIVQSWLTNMLYYNTWQVWTRKKSFFPSRQLLFVQCCLAWGNHIIMAGRGENWQSTGELGWFCFSCSVTDMRLLNKTDTSL